MFPFSSFYSISCLFIFLLLRNFLSKSMTLSHDKTSSVYRKILVNLCFRQVSVVNTFNEQSFFFLLLEKTDIQEKQTSFKEIYEAWSKRIWTGAIQLKLQYISIQHLTSFEVVIIFLSIFIDQLLFTDRVQRPPHIPLVFPWRLQI